MRLLLLALMSLASVVTVRGRAMAAPSEAPANTSKPDRPTFDVTLRINLRGEARTNAGAAANPNADQWQVSEGVRLGVVAGYKALKVVGQVQDVRNWGLGVLSTDRTTGLHQGYIEVGGQANEQVSGFVRIGRQEVVYGSRRFFHKSPWHPAGRAFDAVRAHLAVGKASLDAMYMMLGAPRTLSVFDVDGNSIDTRTGGDHIGVADIGYDFHAAAQLHLATIVQRVGPSEDNAARDEFFVMPGGRLTGQILPGLDYDAEGWLQRGRDGAREHRAWMAAIGAQYIAPVKLQPGVRGSYEVYSGEGCSGDPRQGEACGASIARDFDQLDGARHFYRGHMDLFAGSNLRDLTVTGLLSPAAELRAEVAYHFVQLQAANGRWYNLSGESAWGDGWDPTNTANTLGHEIDVELIYQPWKYLAIRPGYSVFIKGPAARQQLPPEAMHFVFLWFIAEF